MNFPLQQHTFSMDVSNSIQHVNKHAFKIFVNVQNREIQPSSIEKKTCVAKFISLHTFFFCQMKRTIILYMM